MDEREQALRATAEDLIVDAEELKAIETAKAAMDPDDPEADALAEDADRLVREMGVKTVAQREIAADD